MRLIDKLILDITMKKLLLIDGSSMLVTNYYGNLPKSLMFEKDPEKQKSLYQDIMHSENGEYTNALYGMLRTILKIIENQKPEYIAFAFDKTRDTFRRDLYADYKGTRKDTPQPLKEQFIAMENILMQLGFKVYVNDTYEADDLIGTLAHKFENEIPVVVMTKDHDYLQLVSENTRAWMVQTKQETCNKLLSEYTSFWGVDKEMVHLPDKVFEYTADIVEAEEGVLPSQIIDLKGIVGDTSDNIPGVRGVAGTATIPLLKEYGTVEGIYEAIDTTDKDMLENFWKDSLGIKKGAYKKLTAEGARESAFLSKKLATIVDIPELDVVLEDLKADLNRMELAKICARYNFKSIK